MRASARSNGKATAQLDANRKREYTWQYNIGVQHELLPRVSVSANWFYTRFYNLGVTYNALQSFSDYTPVQVASPIDGSAITVYNVSAAANVNVLNLETNATDRQQWNKAIELPSMLVSGGPRSSEASRLIGHSRSVATTPVTYGTASYLQPSTTLIPRVARIGLDVKW